MTNQNETDHSEDSARSSVLRQWLTESEGELRALEARRAEIDQHIEQKRAELTYLRGLLDIHVGQATPAQLPRLTGPAGHPADLVVQLLSEAGKPLHYRVIERELRARGLYVAGGQDPANTLLAHYFNDPRVYRPQRGTYALRESDRGARNFGARRRRATRG